MRIIPNCPSGPCVAVVRSGAAKSKRRARRPARIVHFFGNVPPFTCPGMTLHAALAANAGELSNFRYRPPGTDAFQ